MWWLDDDSFRNNSSDRQRLFLGARFYGHGALHGLGVEPAHKAGRSQRVLRLTEAQHAANKTLQEIGSDQDDAARELRENARAVEQAACRHAAKQGELEARLVQERDRHRSELKNYAAGAKQNAQLIRQQLEESQQRIRQQAAELEQLKGLRALLLAAEQKIAARDRELDELRQECEALSTRSATRLEEAEHRHQSELAFLQSAANDSEQRCSKLQQENAKLREFSQRLSATHQAQLQQTRRGHETSQLSLQTELETANETVAQQCKEMERLKSEIESLKNENEVHQRKISALTQKQQIADETIRQLKHDGAKSDEVSVELDRAGDALKRVRSDNERLLELQSSQYSTLQARVDELIAQLDAEQAKRKQAERDAGQLSQEQSQETAPLRGQRDALLAEINQLRAKNSISSYRLTQRLQRAQHELQDLQRASQNQTQSASTELTSTLAERDRTIEQLRREAMRMQSSLQREAAARRKAEGAIKRLANTDNPSPAVCKTWSEIDMRDQLQRLRKQVQALKAVNLQQHRRAA